ncbi:MAG: phospholipid carrier-dependent glycosyltransferase [Nitrosotalea sp.]
MNITYFVSTKSNYIILALFFGALLIYGYNLEGQPRHGDEINYLGWAGNYIHLINTGDLANSCLISIDNCNSLYHIPAHGATYSPLRMILIGFPLSITHQDNGNFYDWSCYWFTCYNFHYAPTVVQMASGRLLSPIFGALTIAVAFLVGKILFNKQIGLIFSILFLFFNLWIWYSRTIMTEVHYIFFSMLSLLLLLYSFKTGQMKIKYFILSTISFGCAITSKLLSVEFFPLFATIITLSYFFNSNKTDINTKKIVKIISVVSVFFLLSIFSFLLTQPGFYKDPLLQIKTIKSDMDNYNRDVWFIAYPTIQGIQPTRIISLFHYTLFPSPIQHTIPGAYPNSTFDVNWNNPSTNSSIPIMVFFFIGLFYLIQRIRKSRECKSEILLLSWFVSTFILTLMIARDFSLERYLLPFLISIIFIASYGFWNFIKNISSMKIKISFTAYLLFTHAITAMSFWQKIYQSPGTFWTNPLPYGTLQESLINPVTLFVNLTFIAFFIYLMTIRVRVKVSI